MKYLKPLGWQKMEETQNKEAEDKLHQKLINNFVKDNTNKYGEIAEALKAGDIKLAHRLAHTLKSNAGHLGKALLQKTAADVEHQLKDGQNLVTADLMVTLETTLAAALAELAPLVKDVSEAAALTDAEPISAEAGRELIEKLQPMLEQGDLGARQFTDDLRRIPGSGDLIKHMEDLDFDLALASLTELKKGLG